jgi:hypothetical protein
MTPRYRLHADDEHKRLWRRQSEIDYEVKQQADLAGRSARRSAELQSEIARKAQSATRYAVLVASTIAVCSAYVVLTL